MQNTTTIERLGSIYQSLSPLMDERMRRQWAAAEAWGGIRALSGVTGLSSTTIRKGFDELASWEANSQEPIPARLRQPGGGRKRRTEADPDLLPTLRRLPDPVTRGDTLPTLKYPVIAIHQVEDKENMSAKAGVAISNEEPKPLRSILEGFLFYIGIPALTVYPLGFVALCLQMWRDQYFPYSWDFGEFNYGMTWYAASLVPKVVVVGMGLRLLFLSLLACVLAMGIASLTSNFLHRRWKVRQKWWLIENWNEHSRWEIMLWRLSFVTLLPLTAYVVWHNFGVDQWYDAPFFMGFIMFSAMAGIIVVQARHRDRGRWLLYGLAAAYAAAFLAALSLSPLQWPDLPLVEFDTVQGERYEKPSGEPFVMLNQTAGYWNVYNRTSGILSVPDDEAKITRQWDDQSVDKPKPGIERDNPSGGGISP